MQTRLHGSEQDSPRAPVLAPAPRRLPSTPGGEAVKLQRTIGNRAVARMLASSLEVTPADHGFERQAEQAERAAGDASAPVARASHPRPSRRSPLATGGGAPLDTTVRRGLEPSLGSLDAVRVHTGQDADALTASLGAEALTHGSDVFVASDHYRPSTQRGAGLLAHEAAHATGPAVASGRIHLKRSKKHLDFLRVKKKETHIAREVAYRFLTKIGAKSQAGKVITDQHGDEYDTYGHWWVEAGSLGTPGDLSSWRPAESYGWWPSTSVSLLQTLKIDRVDGLLNQGGGGDPHEGDRAEIEYHPVLEVDDAADYDTVRDRVVGDVRSFATGFTGSWNWRLAWGKNCHTFIDRLKKRLKLHHQSAKGWLSGAGVAVAAPPLKSFAEIRKDWALVRGQGFGLTDRTMSVLAGRFGLADLAALSDDEKAQLVSIVNDGVDGWNRIRANELNERLATGFGSSGAVDVFADRHILAEDASESEASGGVDVDAFLDTLEMRTTHTLTADLVVGTKTYKAGGEIFAIQISGTKVQIEFPIAAGAARVWIEADKLAPALNAI